MVTLREVMSSELVTVSPELTLHELAQVLAERHISGAPVVDGEQLVGVISTSDLLDFETETPGAARYREDQTEWGELETFEQTGREDDGAAPALWFSELWPDAGADVMERFETSETLEWNHLAERTVGEAMTTAVCSFPPDTSVQEAARFMLEARIHRVLVVDAGVLVGIVTSTDIVRAVADHGLCA
jgi:CBS domain-containing protein